MNGQKLREDSHQYVSGDELHGIEVEGIVEEREKVRLWKLTFCKCSHQIRGRGDCGQKWQLCTNPVKTDVKKTIDKCFALAAWLGPALPPWAGRWMRRGAGKRDAGAVVTLFRLTLRHPTWQIGWLSWHGSRSCIAQGVLLLASKSQCSPVLSRNVNLTVVRLIFTF